MDCRTGRIYQLLEDAPLDVRPFLKEMRNPPTAKQLKEGRVRRNDKCPCGSNKKFKACCKIDETVTARQGHEEPRVWTKSNADEDTKDAGDRRVA